MPAAHDCCCLMLPSQTSNRIARSSRLHECMAPGGTHPAVITPLNDNNGFLQQIQLKKTSSGRGPNPDPMALAVYRNLRYGQEEYWDAQGWPRSNVHPPLAPGQISGSSTLSNAYSSNMLGVAGPRAPLGGPDIMNQVEQTQMSLHWVPLPYIDYDSGRRLGESHVLYFQNKGGHEFALSLVKQRGRDAINDLVGRDTPAPLGNASAKLSIRLHFEGTIQYTRQIMARRSTAHAEPISMGNLAYKIALEMEAFMKETGGKGQPLRYRGRDVEFSELLLWRLRQCSLGSWVPEFMIAEWQYRD